LIRLLCFTSSQQSTPGQETRVRVSRHWHDPNCWPGDPISSLA